MSAAANESKPFVLFEPNEKFLSGESPSFHWMVTSRRSVYLAVVGTSAALAGLVLILMSSPLWFDPLRFELDADRTEGRVITMATTWIGEGYLHQVTYRYDAGGPHERKETVSEVTYKRLYEGDIVPVRYRQSNPDDAYLDVAAGYRRPFEMPITGVMLIAVGSVGVYHLCRLWARAAQLVRRGVRLPGEVVE